MIESIKELCRTNEYFNINDEKDLFGRMLDMVFDKRFSNREIAAAIWVCSRGASLEQVEKEISQIRTNPKKILINSDVPIYEQIEQQIKAQILEGKIAENEQLPSVRHLAKELKISVITTTRAYNDLAEEGFIVSVAGKGYFVAPRELLRERMLYEMEKGLEKAVTNGRNAGLSDEEIVEALSKIQTNPKEKEL